MHSKYCVLKYITKIDYSNIWIYNVSVDVSVVKDDYAEYLQFIEYIIILLEMCRDFWDQN